MVQEGYAAVTYGNIATATGVTKALAQYHFPKIDDLFVAMLERRGQESLQRLHTALADRPDDPLRVVWESMTEYSAAALTVEFMALANHRKTIRAEILDVTERLRSAQLDAVRDRWDQFGFSEDGPPPEGIVFLLQAISKMVVLEESIGMTSGHREVLEFVERTVEDTTT